MTRSRPTVSSPNAYDAYLRQARAFADRLAACGGVVGVLLTGGVARGYAERDFEGFLGWDRALLRVLVEEPDSEISPCRVGSV